jgi:serine protease Do
MTTAIDEWEGMTFALPLSQEFIAWTIKSIETFGKISRPVIGIQYVEITPSLKTEKKLMSSTGIYVSDILTDLPAWEAWLKVGDLIVAINDNEITRQMPFLYQLYTYIPGDTITLSIIRDGKTMVLTVVLGGNTQ